MMADCGCTISNLDYPPNGPGDIVFCPLHAAAPDFLEAAKKILWDFKHGVIDYTALKAAIAKAEGQ